MDGLFYNCQSLKHLNLSSFNTKEVFSMEEMFYNNHNLNILNLSSFNTINTQIMKRMFANCYNLQLLDLSNFNLANVYYYFYKDMFDGIIRNITIITKDKEICNISPTKSKCIIVNKNIR